ncbi:MAG: DUF2911 domain-containing protein [Acidobacteriota bacterium]|nr:DUF2911 domain-containing protein [Acidobacteriota bacterium]
MQRTKILALSTCLLVCGLLAAADVAAQGVTVPRASQRAELTQTVGMTDIHVVYHRPQVNDREIWGTLVPYDQPWRAGANENTVVSFSHDVQVEGKDLAAGTYGLHVIPTEDEWTVIFSTNSSSWGSFFYDPAEDALRVQVKPEKNSHTELLTYDVLASAPDAATLVLDWEKVRMPVEIAVDTPGITMASLSDQLRGPAGFTWMGWQQAANYAIQNDQDLEQAAQWLDTSIQTQENFVNLRTRSQLLEKTGDEAGAQEAMKQAVALATPLQLHNYGRQLIAQGDVDRAVEIFELNAQRNPEVWFVDIGLARGYSAAGKLDKAAEHMAAGAKKAPEAQRAAYEGMAEQLRNGTSI